jgi:fatty acid synthase
VTSADLPEPETTHAITMTQVLAFADVSCDHNAIHVSVDAARAAGLEGPVLHGMIVAGRFETFLERLDGFQIVELLVRFVRPVPVGSALRISSRHIGNRDRGLRLRLLATIEDGVLVAIAEAGLIACSDQAESPDR